jgi:hypothetical protein
MFDVSKAKEVGRASKVLMGPKKVLTKSSLCGMIKYVAKARIPSEMRERKIEL